MSSPQDSFTSSTTSRNTDFDDHQSLLARLNLLLPTADNKHIAFRLLLDAALHIRLSHPTDRVFLSMLVKGNVTPLRIAKLNLLKLLNSAWHPILDECEQQLEPYLNSFPNITFPKSSEAATWNETDYSATPPQPTVLSYAQQSPPSAELLDLNMENSLSFSSGYDYSNHGLRSSPVHIDSYAAWLESGVDYGNTTPSAPLVGSAARSTGVEVGQSIPAASSEECEAPYVSSMHEYMIAPAHSSPIYRTLPGEFSNSTSKYSSLLPESHCPPFAKINHSSLGCGLPSQSPDAITTPCEPSAALGTNDFLSPGMTDTSWSTNYEAPDPQYYDDYTTFLEDPNYVADPSVAFAGGMMAQEDINRTLNDQNYSSALTSISLSTQAPNVCDSSSLPSTSNVSPGGQSEQIAAATHARKKRRAKRVFERPPGLPLGPWTPGEMGPLPETVPLKKPRKVRRAPTSQHRSSSQQGLSEKVSCPKCSTIVLAKSLNRHLERHYNWAEGQYSAHLYCRYCFTPYCRMDLLIRHQKTDAQCVMLQYDIYWSGRQPYLEKQIQIWRENAERARASRTL